ncbi:MAG: prepilin-type N-terminal cleavage/methylation domain-containing protein [Bacilli bacterium]|nr:prepilin-type N-terminal cleavage/methylation domain-containing protein [Bacilli bacterium]MDD4406469.1 prepilin-type N-terminal cleavage/methylation domain-containing protein [Bacilli bacterium]
MKNNKGFTLIEVIVTVSILAIIMIITIPSINNVMKNSKEQISSITKKNIEESAKLFGQEVYMCDRTSDIISVLNKLFNRSNITCKEARNILTSSGITVTIGFLKEKEYFSDRSNNCDETGEVLVKLQTNEKITVELQSNIKCK